MNTTPTVEDRIVRWPEVETTTGLARVTAWRLEKKGEFPKRRKLGANSVGWLYSEIQEWITSRKTA